MRHAVKALKHLAEVSVSNVDKKSVEGETPVRLVNYTDVYYGDRLSPSRDLMSATASRRQLDQFQLQSGDVLITKDSETADDIGVPAYVESSKPGMVCGYHLAMIRVRSQHAHGRFLYWAMRSDSVAGQLETRATGVTRFGLRADVIRSVEIPTPTLDGQRTIADYLDTETARIDALIIKKRRLIEILDERWKVLAESLLSKDSTLVPLRRLMATMPQYGASVSGLTERPPRGVRYLRITDLHSDGTVRSDNPRFLELEDARPYLLRDGDLLFARSGATSGKAFFFQAGATLACFAGYLIRISLDPSKLLPELAAYWSQTSLYWSQIRATAVQATIENVSAERYKELLVPVPPRDEQLIIASKIRAAREKVALLHGRLLQQVELLAEHRDALITAAVTGDLQIPGTAV